MIKDRILQLIERKRVPKGKTFAELGVTSANFRGRAKQTPLNSDCIARLFALFPDLNLEWLITGNGPCSKTTPSPTRSPSTATRSSSARTNACAWN